MVEKYCSVVILILLMFLHAVSSNYSNHTQLCPLWMSEAPQNVNPCRCPDYYCGIDCQRTDFEKLTLYEGYCLSFDNTTGHLTLGICPYAYDQFQLVKELNSTVTGEQLNKVVCGPLNRQGLLCSKCKPNYGVPVYSKERGECVECGSKLTWLLYLALELLPLTAFYILVIIFNFSATKPPFTAYIFYCQLFTQIPDNIPFIHQSFKLQTNHIFLYLVLTICDVWNLNILRYIVPKFCLSEKLSALDSVFLELITAFYPIVLIIVTYTAIEMHARNCKIFVWMWKPFHKCFVSIRRSWDPKSSVVNACTSFLLLSSFKIALLNYKIWYNIALRKVTAYDDSNHDGCDIEERHVMYIDPTMSFSDNHAYVIPMIVLNVIFLVLPMLLLCFYPTRVFKQLLQFVCSGRVRSAIFMFVESFQGHYKNGTTGTYDYRSTSCIGFLLRILIGLLLSLRWSRHPDSNNGPISMIAGLLIFVSLYYALVRPCKKRYMNTIESLLYITAGCVLITIIHNNNFRPLFHIILAIILLPNVVIMGVISYRILMTFKVINKLKHAICNRKRNAPSEDEPDRLVHPSEYSPLSSQKSIPYAISSS